MYLYTFYSSKNKVRLGKQSNNIAPLRFCDVFVLFRRDSYEFIGSVKNHMHFPYKKFNYSV